MPVNIPLNIILHKNQQFIQDNARTFNVVKAGKRFGKSKLAMFRLLQRAGLAPNGVVWYIAPFFSMAREIAWRDLLAQLPANMYRNKDSTECRLELFNGCLVKLKGADHVDSLRGPQLNHVTLDEAAFIKEDVWPLVRGQLIGKEGSGTADFISSPNPKGMNWFSEFWADAKKKMDAGDPDWSAFYFTIRENPTLSKDYVDKLEADTSEETWRLEYLAIESEFAGTMFSEFRYDLHVKPFVEEKLAA